MGWRLALAGFVLAAALPSIGSPPADTGPRLAYVQPRGELYELRSLDPGSRQSRVLQSFVSPPLMVIWARQRPEVTTVRNSGLYRSNLLVASEGAVPVGDPPPAGLVLHDGWLGEDGQTVRVLGTEPRSGVATCVLYEVPAAGAWRPLPLPPAPPNVEADDCGDAVPSEERSARSVSSAELSRRQRCTAAGSACDNLGGPGDDPYRDVRSSVLRRARGLEAVAIADPRSTPFYLAAGVRVGETPHLADPVFLVSRDGPRLRVPAIRTPPQVELGLAGRFALIAAEYSGRDPIVMDLVAGREVLRLRGAFGAVWVP